VSVEIEEEEKRRGTRVGKTRRLAAETSSVCIFMFFFTREDAQGAFKACTRMRKNVQLSNAHDGQTEE
jgi:hypothetical protein